jgi:hypothetical protein
MGEMTPEQSAAAMAGWQAWMGKAAGAITDMGAPMTAGRSVVADGSAGTPTLLNGYTIIEAEDIDGAVALLDGHPFLSDGSDSFSVEVFELLPIPSM